MLCDSNVWLALALSKHVHHTAARELVSATPVAGNAAGGFAAAWEGCW